jgi:glycosyltransferase involved in cell wall biosynthesis
MGRPSVNITTMASISERTDGSAEPESLVSVVIPVFNRAHLIGHAIESVLAQTYGHFEIIVVDDASTDDLATALAKIADPRLRCIAHPQNFGAAAARNTGIAAAKGEFIAFLDSDDSWYSDKLAFQVAAMRDQPPEIAGHVCAYDCIKSGYAARRVAPNWLNQPFPRAVLFGCTCGPGTTLLCRREVFAEVGPFDETLRRQEDWDWLLRLAAKGHHLLASRRALARVEVGTSASRRDVEAALRHIGARHLAKAARQGAAGTRIFEASLRLEKAAAAFGEKAYLNALSNVMCGLARYPLRGGAFYWRLVQRAAGSLGNARRHGTSPR